MEIFWWWMRKTIFGSRKPACYLIFKVTGVSVNNNGVVLDNFCLTRVYLANCFASTNFFKSGNTFLGKLFFVSKSHVFFFVYFGFQPLVAFLNSNFVIVVNLCRVVFDSHLSFDFIDKYRVFEILRNCVCRLKKCASYVFLIRLIKKQIILQFNSVNSFDNR